MKKKQIANLVMVVIILLIVAAGVLGVGFIRGWFDKETEETTYLTEVQGIVNIERNDVSYPVEQETILRSGDKITTNPGATAVIRRDEDIITLGGNLELVVTDAVAKQLTLQVINGEVFVNSEGKVHLMFELGEAVAEKATIALSVRKGAQTVSVFRGAVGEIAAGQTAEYVGGDVSICSMRLESMNDFMLSQIRKMNQTVALCFTNKDLDDLNAKRQQAIQDMLNGQEQPQGHSHDYTVTVIAPTCSEGGYTEYVCECGEQYQAEPTEVLDHSWAAWEVLKAATTKEEGILKRVCQNCDVSEQKTEEKITEDHTENQTEDLTEDHTHSYTTEVIAPTCSTEGYTQNICLCGHSYKSNTVPAKDHSYHSQVVKPTCEAQGYTVFTCTCGATYTDNTVASVGHKWSDWKTVTEATEKQEGHKEHKCSVCGKKEQQTIPKKDPQIIGYVNIEILCDTILNNMGDLTPGKEEFVPGNGVILPMVQVPFYENETVFEVLNRICKKTNIQIEYSWTPLYDSYYIEGINHLYEFDCGEQSGWMYKVNEWFPNYGCSSYYVEDGDMITWCFTCKGLGVDVGCEWMGEE